MSFKLMALAATAKTQTPTQKLILLLLADKANDEGICWPKMSTIAEDACVTRQCVLENVKKLAALGFIQVQKRAIRDEELGCIRNASHIYRVSAVKMRDSSGVRVNEVYSENVRVNEDDTPCKPGLHPHVNEDDNKNLSVEPIIEPINICPDFLENFNRITGRSFRVLDQKTKRQLRARIEEGFSSAEILKAAENCKKDKFHVENPHFLTPEFITRSDKLQKYLNAGGSQPTPPNRRTVFVAPNE